MSFLRPTRAASRWLKHVFEPSWHSLENTKLRTDAPASHIAAVFLGLSFLSGAAVPHGVYSEHSACDVQLGCCEKV